MPKTVLLTGGCGFIGHHTVEHWLKNTDWNIVILDRLTYAGNQNFLTSLDCWEMEKDRVKFIFHDFRAPFTDSVLSMVAKTKPDYIVHMGAETHVDNSIRDSRIFVESNVIGTHNVLELGRQIFPEKFIYVSTDEVYGPVVGNKLHKEGEPHNPSNPYSATKSGAEALCRAWHTTYGMPIIISNTMNNFGERQHWEKFVPMIVRNALLRKPVTAHCKKIDGSVVDVSTRCWLHARNHADALMYLLNNSTAYGESYNVVGELHDVVEMIRIISYIMQVEIEFDLVDFHSTRPGHDMHYGLDGTKMYELGWREPVPFYDSLSKTVLWMMNHPEWLGL